MFEKLSDKDFFYISVVFVTLFFLPLGYYLATSARIYYEVPPNPTYINGIAGLNLADLDAGNYSYTIEVKNPNKDLAVRVYFFLFADPPEQVENVTWACSVANATILKPLQQVNTTFSLAVLENLKNAEYYFRVGSYRIGVDY